MITERSIKLLSSVMLISANRIKVLRLWLTCFEDWPIRILTFAWWMLKTRNTMVSWHAFPSLPPRAPLVFLSRLNNSLSPPFQMPSTQASRSTKRKFWFVGREFNQQTNNFGFPRYKTNSKLDLRGKDKVLTVKSLTETPFRETYRATKQDQQTRLWSEVHWKLLLYLNFARSLKLLAQLASMFSVNCFRSQYF